MATPSPQPLAHIKTAARKLPVKRRSPNAASSSAPAHPAAPAPVFPVKLEDITSDADAAPGAACGSAGPDDFDDDEDEVEGEEGDRAGGKAGAAAAIPFKFQRIWSEPDEIRFLQGLLACHSQGMAFPRDLNLYFDRFSEAMTQPYTRSQLSEKLRRLRKKFRSHSARVARGLDPSALPPHDRDLFHLSTLLWDPAFAASSPFGSSGGGAVPGNKRRRHIPVAGVAAAAASAGVGRARTSTVPSPTRPTPAALPPPALSSPPPAPREVSCDGGIGGCNGFQGDSQEGQLPLQPRKLFIGSDSDGLGRLAAKTALDVFDSCLKDVRARLVRRGLLHSDQPQGSGPQGDLLKRWREQQVAELDVLARRLRLALEQAVED